MREKLSSNFQWLYANTGFNSKRTQPDIMMVKCKFGKPAAGWLPVELLLERQFLEFHVSNVPEDPIRHLIVGLDRAITGWHDEVFFHLEPDGYLLCFQHLAKDSFKFRLDYLESRAGRSPIRTLIHESTGSKKQVIFPFWRAIKEFASHCYVEPAWTTVDNAALQNLTRLVKTA